MGKKMMRLTGLVVAGVLAFAGTFLFAGSKVVQAENGMYSEDGTASCVVTATLESSYTVSLPAAIALSYDAGSGEYRGSFSYGVKGNIAADKGVRIVAPGSFSLTGEASGESVSAGLTLPFTVWSNEEESGVNAQISTSSYVMKEGSVSAAITRADRYSGNFSFTFGLDDV